MLSGFFFGEVLSGNNRKTCNVSLRSASTMHYKPFERIFKLKLKHEKTVSANIAGVTRY